MPDLGKFLLTFGAFWFIRPYAAKFIVGEGEASTTKVAMAEAAALLVAGVVVKKFGQGV